MIAEEALKAGALKETLAALQGEVRQKPADAKKRIFLFQLLCVLGDWERALNQLKVLGEMDPATLAMVMIYREAIRCEVLRERVFAGETNPLIFGEPQRWVALLVEALRLDAQSAPTEAARLREEAFESAPASPGSIQGEPFAWIADADPRLGPILEVILEGKYYWIPWMHVAEMTVTAPEDLRDLIWTPASFTWTNGGTAIGLIPARYPGSATCEDDRLRLGRLTEWQETAPGLYRGLGQRLLATDQGEYPLLEVREVILTPALPEEGAEAPAATDG